MYVRPFYPLILFVVMFVCFNIWRTWHDLLNNRTLSRFYVYCCYPLCLLFVTLFLSGKIKSKRVFLFVIFSKLCLFNYRFACFIGAITYCVSFQIVFSLTSPPDALTWSLLSAIPLTPLTFSTWSSARSGPLRRTQ